MVGTENILNKEIQNCITEHINADVNENPTNVRPLASLPLQN